MTVHHNLKGATTLTRSRPQKSDLRQLPTEQILSSTANLDQMSSLEIVQLINDEDATVAAAVRRALPQVARAIDVVANGLRHVRQRYQDQEKEQNGGKIRVRQGFGRLLWMPVDQQGLRIRIPAFKSAGFLRRSPSTHSIQFNPPGLVLSFQSS